MNLSKGTDPSNPPYSYSTDHLIRIHMIPITPISPWYRDPVFCREEWETWFSNGRVDKNQGGWNGILQANRAIFDPKGSWMFFTSNDFVNEYLDPGASKSWYLALIAGMCLVPHREFFMLIALPAGLGGAD